MKPNRRLKRRVRNSYIISTVSIALVLFLLGSVGYLILTALDATDRIKESVSVNVMLKDGVDDARLAEIRTALSAMEASREVTYISKDAAAKEFREYAGDDFEQLLDYNPLPASFEVKLTASGPESASMAAFEREVAGWEGVDEVVYQRNVVEKIGDNINKFNLVLLLFGGALLVISIILLNNTVRMSILSKRYIINTMKLVGATKWFIMKPFLRTSLLQGIYAAAVATLMFAAMVWGLHERLPEIRFSDGTQQLLLIVGGMFAGGVLISLVFTIFEVNKFVRMPSGAVHYY